MYVMAETLKRHVANDGLPSEATITACEQTSQETFTDEGYTPPEYQVSFAYVVDGQVLEGSYRATLPQECEHSFELLYDPEEPSRNTGSDTLVNPWLKWEQESSSELGWRCWLAGFGAIKDWFRN